MIKNYFVSFIFIIAIGRLSAQAPVMNPISGASVVCSAPSAATTFSTSASNSPTSYSWSVVPAAGVVIGTPTASTTTINFPYSNGTYTIYCTATNGFGTSAPMSYVVNVFETPTVTFSGATSFCQGSSTNISASSTMLSASPTINYFWSPPTGLNTTVGPNVQASPTTSTTYSVLATKGPCSNTGTITITVNPNPTITVSVSNSVICQGNPTTLTASGALSYTWTSSVINGVPFNPPSSSSYMVTGANSFGCKNTAFAFVTVNPAPVINASSNPSLACMGQTVTISFSGTSTSYSFNSVSSGNSVVVSPTVNTTYTISGVTSQGCKGSIAYTQYVGCVGINDPTSPEYLGLKAYPNPSAGQFMLTAGNDETVSIYNELGQLSKTISVKANEKVSINDLDPGVYFLVSPSSRIKIIVLK